MKWQLIFAINWFEKYIMRTLNMIGQLLIRPLLPFMFLVFVYYYDIWNEIDTFRWVLLYFYVFCLFIVIIMTLDIMPISIYLFHIFPSKKLPQMAVKFSYVEWHYETIMKCRFHESYLKDKFGNDVSNIIIQYVGTFDFVQEEKQMKMQMYRRASLLGK